VTKTEGCWVYRSATGGGGYKRLQINGDTVSAHRFSWELHFGPVPGGLLVCHRCDNRPCIRPDHLFLGTHADNAADKVSKGRQARCGPGPTLPRGEAHYAARLTEADIRLIRKRHADGSGTPKALAMEYAVNKSTIHKILRREKWAHVN